MLKFKKVDFLKFDFPIRGLVVKLASQASSRIRAIECPLQ